MESRKKIALVAHDEMKLSLIQWAKHNHETLNRHILYATGTTGGLLKSQCALDVTCLKSGPLGGDLELGTMISNNQLDLLIFFWDPMTAQPHDVDIKALLRISAVYNIPLACNQSTADFLISSALFNQPYKQQVKNYNTYTERTVSGT